MVQPITTWSEFKLVIRQLEKPEAKERFKTICLDTIGIAFVAEAGSDVTVITKDTFVGGSMNYAAMKGAGGADYHIK